METFGTRSTWAGGFPTDQTKGNLLGAPAGAVMSRGSIGGGSDHWSQPKFGHHAEEKTLAQWLQVELRLGGGGT
jgi:hypothetical protein